MLHVHPVHATNCTLIWNHVRGMRKQNVVLFLVHFLVLCSLFMPEELPVKKVDTFILYFDYRYTLLYVDVYSTCSGCWKVHIIFPVLQGDGIARVVGQWTPWAVSLRSTRDEFCTAFLHGVPVFEITFIMMGKNSLKLVMPSVHYIVYYNHYKFRFSYLTSHQIQTILRLIFQNCIWYFYRYVLHSMGMSDMRLFIYSAVIQ